MELVISAVLGLVFGGLLAWLVLRSRTAGLQARWSLTEKELAAAKADMARLLLEQRQLVESRARLESALESERKTGHEKIELLTPYAVEEIHNVDNKAVELVKIRNQDTKELKEISVEGVFVAIGHDPNTKVFRGLLEMDDAGYLLTHDGSKTSVEGVFAAGDVQDHHYRQAITAAGSGCMAAMDAEKFLARHKS